MVKRCIRFEDKKKFLDLMGQYEKTANFFNTTIADNPSPGNIADGLITDAIKSTGAAKKAENRRSVRCVTMRNRCRTADCLWSAHRGTMWMP